MIIYVIDGGYGPEPAQTTGAFPPAAIVLLTVLLAWVSTGSCSSERGNRSRHPAAPVGATGRDEPH